MPVASCDWKRLAIVPFIRSFEFPATIPDPLHRQLLDAVRQYLVIGGMPASVFAYTRSESLVDTESEKQSILETFAEDFGKYARRANPDRLRKVFTRLPLLIGQRLKYAHIDRDSGAKSGPCLVIDSFLSSGTIA